MSNFGQIAYERHIYRQGRLWSQLEDYERDHWNAIAAAVLAAARPEGVWLKSRPEFVVLSAIEQVWDRRNPNKDWGIRFKGVPAASSETIIPDDARLVVEALGAPWPWPEHPA